MTIPIQKDLFGRQKSVPQSMKELGPGQSARVFTDHMIEQALTSEAQPLFDNGATQMQLFNE